MSDELKVWYALPISVVKITGKVTVRTDESGAKVPERTSKVSLAVEADADNRHLVAPRASSWSSREFELSLEADERLGGATHSASGHGAEVISAGLRVAGLAAKVVGHAAAAVSQSGLQTEDMESILRAEQAELARRRAECGQVIDRLQRKLIGLGNEAAQEEPGADIAAAVAATQAAIAAARSEKALLDARFDKWRTERFPEATTTFAYTLRVDRLPTRDQASPRAELTENELGNGQVGEILRTLGVAVVRVGDRDPTEHSDTFGEDGIRYRLPRACELAVYEADPHASDPRTANLELRKVQPVWIVDSSSELGWVPFESGAFKKHGAGVSFGDTGALAKLTNKQTGAAGILAPIVSGAGAQVVESIEQGGKISEALAKPDPPDEELDALKKQVTRKELEAKLVTAQKTINGEPEKKPE